MTDAELRSAYARAMAVRGLGERAACPTPDAIQALVERTVSEPERLTTLDHVMQCVPCHDEFELLRALREGAPASRRFALPPRWIAAAAAVVLVVTSTILWRLDEPERGVMRAGADGVSLLEPTGVVSASEARTLIWNAVPEATRYVVELFAGDSVRYAAEVRDTVLTIPDSVALAPGEHGWWVRARYSDGAERISRFQRFTVRAPE
jgi:hypothetical protein